MTKEELYEELDYIDHSREKRSIVAKAILKQPAILQPLLEIAFMVDDPISAKACWAIEYATKQDLRLIFPQLNYLTDNLHKPTLESAIRPMAKICELLMLDYFKNSIYDNKNHITETHLEKISTACFDWLIGDHKVASKAYSMTSLLLLGSKFDWIHPELKMVIEQNYANGSAAYKARARHTLAKLK